MKDINDKTTQVNDEVPKHENGKDYSSLSPTPTQMIKKIACAMSLIQTVS